MREKRDEVRHAKEIHPVIALSLQSTFIAGVEVVEKKK